MPQANFEDFTITPEMEVAEWNFEETDGVLQKFWIDHDQLGKTLVKIDRQNYADSWSEKVAAELSSQIGIPHAQYELGNLVGFEDYKDGTAVILSQDFELDGHKYAQGFDLLDSSFSSGNYTVAEVISVLELADVQLPLNYQAPEGIRDGADLFVGYLALDLLIDNFDRHPGNWGYSISEQDDIKRLTPTYDHGVSLGAILDSENLKNVDIKEYTKFSKSAFGSRQTDGIKQAAKLRPQTTQIWLKQLSKISQEEVKAIFDRLPDGRISPESSRFAQELIQVNQDNLLTLGKDISQRSQQINEKSTPNTKQNSDSEISAAQKLEKLADGSNKPYDEIQTINQSPSKLDQVQKTDEHQNQQSEKLENKSAKSNDTFSSDSSESDKNFERERTKYSKLAQKTKSELGQKVNPTRLDMEIYYLAEESSKTESEGEQILKHSEKYQQLASFDPKLAKQYVNAIVNSAETYRRLPKNTKNINSVAERLVTSNLNKQILSQETESSPSHKINSQEGQEI